MRNTSGCVALFVEGPDEGIRRFYDELKAAPPPRAVITHIETKPCKAEGYETFSILASDYNPDEYQLISPDIATCPACLSEINDPGDRRFGYPFTNCTNCGPRFTIIRNIPYDRPLTTMADFKMCPRCRTEYEDPADRRFHAQPNACALCGPRLRLIDGDGVPVDTADPVKAATDRLQKGQVLAIKGLGGFQLACDATDADAVALLRQRKKRPDRPFAVMMTNLEAVHRRCIIDEGEQALLMSPAAPIVLLAARSDMDITANVAPGLDTLGVMLPYTPLHHLLLAAVARPLVMTSGNPVHRPIIKDNGAAINGLCRLADAILVHDRDIHSRYDDSVIRVIDGTPVFVRRARGYAPSPVPFPRTGRQILACGAELKNTFCLTRQDNAFISQHIGDLNNEETLAFFEETLDLYSRLFGISPEAVACDLHPDYLSTRFAEHYSRASGLPLIPIQHHHAHIAACLIDNAAPGPVIGVAFDGTGYGPDGTVWGGEFLVADLTTFRRAGHLACWPLPGGDAAVKKPWRTALSALMTFTDRTGLPGTVRSQRFSGTEADIVRQMIKKGVNAPLTSSAGRLFDVIAALTGLCGEATYEAQAAMLLEAAASTCRHITPGAYPFTLNQSDGIWIVGLNDFFNALLRDIEHGATIPAVAFRFHVTLAKIIQAACLTISKETGIDRVALSGGVFQNRLLTGLAGDMLKQKGLKVLVHRQVPANDGGLSLGQAGIARTLFK